MDPLENKVFKKDEVETFFVQIGSLCGVGFDASKNGVLVSSNLVKVKVLTCIFLRYYSIKLQL